MEGCEEQENKPNGPKDYNPHDYRDWKQQIAEYEAEGISSPGNILECVRGCFVFGAPLMSLRVGNTPAEDSRRRTCQR